MKKFLLFLGLMIGVLTVGLSQTTVTYTGMGSVTCPAAPIATISPAVTGLTFSQLSRGSGVTCASAGTGISGSGFNVTLASAISGSKWYTYSITSDATVTFTVSSLSIVSQVSSATGSPSVSVQYSIDAGSKSAIGSFTPTTTSAAYTITPGTPISVGASQTLNIFIIPNTLTATGTTCRVNNNTSVTLTTSPAGIVVPTVTTQSVSSIATTTATGNGTITVTGGENSTTRGVCWDLYANPDPDLSDNYATESGSFGVGAFTSSISGLTAETRYKVVAYATNTSGTGYGAAVNFWTFSNEPSSHSTTFTNSVISQTQIDLSFDAASTVTNADGYLIIQKTGSAPTGVPTDGTSYTVGNTIGGDGTLAAIVTNTSATSASITGLTAGTQYYFTIIPYNYNGSDNETYNYKTDGTIPATNGTTLAALDATSEVSGPVLSSQPDPALISSLATTEGSAVRVFDMDVYDYGTTDVQPTKITQLTIKPGTNNTANWSTVIQGVRLSTDAGSSFVTIGSPTISASSIIIPITSGNLNIPNSDALTVSLYVYLNNSGLTDNQILEFKVDATASSHGFIADATGSTFISTFSTAPVSNQILIDVVATKFNFSTQPSNTTVNTNFSAGVEALDANNNRDLDATTSVTLSASAGTLSSTSGLVQNLIAGIFNWTDLKNNTASTGITLSATGALTTATSSTFRVLSTQPTTQASAIVFSNIGLNSMTVSWTAGNGSDRILVAKASGTPGTPINGTTYTASSNFGDGGTFGANEFVLYNGTGTTVDITGLSASTTYTFKVFEFNGSSGTENYMTTSNATSQVTMGLTYYSTGSVDPTVLTNWKTSRDGTGTSPSNFTSGEAFVIQNSHSMTTTATWSISGTNSKLWIENGGTLTANNAITLSSATTFQVDNGGTYIHNNTSTPSSTIYGGTESFGATSNVRIDNWNSNNTSLTTGVNLPFGNLEIKWTANTNNWQQGWSGSINLCAGSLTVTSVGTGTIRFSAGTAPTVNVAGNFVLTSGTVNMASTSGTSVCVLNVTGNFSVNGGTFTSSSTGSKVAFIGSGEQSFTNAGTISTVNFEVSSTSTLNMGTQVMTGGSFTLPAGATLKTAHASGINGSITTTSKTINAATNYVFNAAGTQVTGALLPSSVASITISGTSDLSLSNTDLTATTVSIESGAKLHIPSAKHLTASTTLSITDAKGLVVESGGSAIFNGSTINYNANGTVLVKQDLVGGNVYYLSSPVSNATRAVFDADGGTVGGKVYYYDANAATNLLAWQLLPALSTTPLEIMRGYVVKYAADHTLQFEGQLNTGTQAAASSSGYITLYNGATYGWNLVGNPYTSSIDIGSQNSSVAGWTWGDNIQHSVSYRKTNGNVAYWVWAGDGTYNGADGGTRYIPQMQAYYINLDGTGSIGFGTANTTQTHSTQQLYKSVGEENNVFRIKAIRNGNDFYDDETTIGFYTNANDAKDAYDASKMIITDTNFAMLYTLSGTEMMAINGMSPLTGNRDIALGFQCFASGTYTFKAKFSAFDNTTDVSLEDLELGITQDLRQNPVYSFTSAPINTLARFVLHFGTAKINGQITYANVVHTPLANATVRLLNSTDEELGSTTTDNNGYYSFNSAGSGAMHVEVVSGPPSGGWNAIDAMLILKHFVNAESLSGIYIAAADATNDGAINSIDALQIQKRFVGLITNFTAPEWVTEKKTVSVTTPGQTVQLNVKTVCTGDVNGSYIP